MKMHYSRFGYTAACGRRLTSTRNLTRHIASLTCTACKSTKLVKKGGN